MKRSARFEKWASIFLGIVCVVLVVNLVLRSTTRVGASRPRAERSAGPAPARGSSSAGGTADDLARYDPAVHVDRFQELQDRPLPKLARNPFEFEPLRVEQSQEAMTSSPLPAAPVTPSPPPLKALGYAEKEGGVREAIVSDDNQIYIVHEGELFAKRFRVVRITPRQVDIEDESTRQTVQLPIAP